MQINERVLQKIWFYVLLVRKMSLESTISGKMLVNYPAFWNNSENKFGFIVSSQE